MCRTGYLLKWRIILHQIRVLSISHQADSCGVSAPDSSLLLVEGEIVANESEPILKIE
jgi:hypothetical protein